MNRKIAMAASAVNCAAVILFAVSMLIGSNIGSYFVCMFIAFSFVPMISAFLHECDVKMRTAGYTALAFACIYATMILIVYFAQLTAVRLDNLNAQAAQIIDYQGYGLFFSYDLLGYGLMALSTFFIGLTVKTASKADKWLRTLLLIHGAFFFTCLIIPMTGAFSSSTQGSEWVGIAVLLVWCAYFIPIDVLSFLHFKKQ